MAQTIFGWPAKLTVQIDTGQVLDVTDCIEIGDRGISINAKRLLAHVVLEMRISEMLTAREPS